MHINWLKTCKNRHVPNCTSEEWEHYFRNNLNIRDLTWDEYQKLQDRLPSNQLWATAANSYHQHNTSKTGKNLKFVSADGHFELIYNADHVLQTKDNNWADMGTYNYYSPNSDEWGHFWMDMVPYDSTLIDGPFVEQPLLGYGNVPLEERK